MSSSSRFRRDMWHPGMKEGAPSDRDIARPADFGYRSYDEMKEQFGRDMAGENNEIVIDRCATKIVEQIPPKLRELMDELRSVQSRATLVEDFSKELPPDPDAVEIQKQVDELKQAAKMLGGDPESLSFDDFEQLREKLSCLPRTAPRLAMLQAAVEYMAK